MLKEFHFTANNRLKFGIILSTGTFGKKNKSKNVRIVSFYLWGLLEK
jgi:hypothetical protein